MLKRWALATQHKHNTPSELDELLLWPALGLLLFGMVMVYSSSIALAEGSRFTGHQPMYFLLRHSVFLCVGLVAGVMAFQIPLRLWQQAAPGCFWPACCCWCWSWCRMSGVRSMVLSAGFHWDRSTCNRRN